MFWTLIVKLMYQALVNSLAEPPAKESENKVQTVYLVITKLCLPVLSVHSLPVTGNLLFLNQRKMEKFLLRKSVVDARVNLRAT